MQSLSGIVNTPSGSSLFSDIINNRTVAAGELLGLEQRGGAHGSDGSANAIESAREVRADAPRSHDAPPNARHGAAAELAIATALEPLWSGRSLPPFSTEE